MVISSKTQQDVYIPVVVGNAEKLVLKSEITEQEYVFENLKGIAGDYYVFNADFSDVPDGEYQYFAGGDSGIIRIGDYKTTNVSYTSDNKHIQYQAFK